MNPSFDNVKDIKWSSILRLRAVENRFFALCTLHDNGRGRTHPFAFSPDGKELMGRHVGSPVTRPLSKCSESDAIYVVDLDMRSADKPLDWSQLPCAKKAQVDRSGQLQRPVRVAMIKQQPALLGVAGWQTVEEPGRIFETDSGSVYVGVIRDERILDAAKCFAVLHTAKKKGCTPILWNTWDELPTDSSRLAMLMMGRAIECCAPVFVSDRTGIHELIELSNRNKIPARRNVQVSREVVVDIGYAWGLDSAFKMVARKLPHNMKRTALDRYRRLA